MSLMFSRKVDALYQYIYLSFWVIINEQNFKDNVFTNSFLRQCVFYHICIFWILFPNLITFYPKLLVVSSQPNCFYWFPLISNLQILWIFWLLVPIYSGKKFLFLISKVFPDWENYFPPGSNNSMFEWVVLSNLLCLSALPTVKSG